MAGHSSNKDGAVGQDSNQPDSGLDAKLDRAVSTGAAEAFLVGVGGIHGGRVYPLKHNTVFVGRGDDADVLVADPSVSARHARILNGSQGFEVEDLGSTNGTFVDGRRVTRAPIESGSRIIIGQVEFKFLVDRRVDATMTVIPAGLPARGRSGVLMLRESPRRPDMLPGMGMPPVMRPARNDRDQRDEDDGPSFEEIVARVVVLYRLLRRNAFFIGVLAGVGALLGLVFALVLPPAGEVVCVLKLLPQVKANPVDAQWNRGAPDGDQEVRFFADAELAFVQPKLVAGTLHNILGTNAPPATVASVTERLRLESEPDHVYRASYREKLIGTSVDNPVAFLTAHIENYLHGEIGRAIRVFSAQADFLRNQLEAVEGDMKKISDQKMQFSKTNSDRLPEEAGQMLGSRFELESRRAELTAQVRKLQGELDAQRRALTAESPLAQQKFQSSHVYRESLAEINRKLTDAYARGLADGHPEIRQLKDEKQRIEALIQKEMSSETSPLDRQVSVGYQELQTHVALLQGQLAAARSDLGDTEKNLGRLQNVVGDLPRVQAGIQQLAHMQDATTALHSQLFEQLKKAELQLNLERVSAESRYEVVSPPRLNKPGRLKTSATRGSLGALFGALAALAVIAARRFREVVARAVSNMEPQGRFGR